MRRIFVPLLAALALCLPTAPAAADEPAFGPPTTLGETSYGPAVVLGPAGDALIAWQASDGVYVARRPAGGGLFSPADRIAAERASEIAVARNGRGDTAVVWEADGAIRLAVAPSGSPFLPAETVPVLERPAGSRTVEFSVRGPSVAVGADGSVAVTYTDSDTSNYPDETRVRPIGVLRSADGAMGAAQVLGPNVRTWPQLAADDAGGIYAVWAGGRAGESRTTPASVHFVESRGGAFGDPVELGAPGGGAFDPDLSANARGDLVVAWSAAEAGAPYPNGVETSFRPAGRGWESLQRLDAHFGNYPGTAINYAGDAAAGWTTGPNGIGAAFRPAGGAFGRDALTQGPQALVGGDVVALDSLGTTIAAWSTASSPSERVVAALRRRDGAFGELVQVSEAGERGGSPEIVTDAYGNGLVVWAGRGRDRPLGVRVAAYSANPPAVSGLKVRSSSIVFEVDEPARVRVALRRAGGGKAVLHRRAAAGRNKLRFGATVTRLLRRGGRFRATVRAADAGPRVARRTRTFRRR